MSTGVCVTGSVPDDVCGDTDEEGPAREAPFTHFESLFSNRDAAQGSRTAQPAPPAEEPEGADP
jgi:hypothetical protein